MTLRYPKINEKQIKAVLALPGAQRFEHFIKVVTNWQEMWGLYNNGWALAATDGGTEVFPVWPAKEYAQLCACDSWVDFKPKSIPLVDAMNDLIPSLRNRGVLIGVFYTPSNKGVTPLMDEFVSAIESELKKIRVVIIIMIDFIYK